MNDASWFRTKFLIDSNATNETVEMASDTHADHIKTVLTPLHLPQNKILHLGRNVGTKALDCDDVDKQEIRRMGQWNQTVHDESHSSKLLMKAMRSLAGHSTGSGIHHDM